MLVSTGIVALKLGFKYTNTPSVLQGIILGEVELDLLAVLENGHHYKTINVIYNIT